MRRRKEKKAGKTGDVERWRGVSLAMTSLSDGVGGAENADEEDWAMTGS